MINRAEEKLNLMYKGTEKLLSGKIGNINEIMMKDIQKEMTSIKKNIDIISSDPNGSKLAGDEARRLHITVNNIQQRIKHIEQYIPKDRIIDGAKEKLNEMNKRIKNLWLNDRGNMDEMIEKGRIEFRMR